MAWTSMHFATGMIGGAAIAVMPCLILRRGWRHIPLGMTLGGLWAIVPDCPRLWREDFTSLPFASTLGSKDFELWLHSIGDLFFFHRSLDAQPKEFALLGLALIIGLYSAALLACWWVLGQRSKARLIDADSIPSTLASTRQSHAHYRQGQPITNMGNESDTVTTDTEGDPIIGRIGKDRSA